MKAQNRSQRYAKRSLNIFKGCLRCLFILAVALGMQAYSFGQRPPLCIRQVSDAPALRGVRLGMTPEEAASAIGMELLPQLESTLYTLEKSRYFKPKLTAWDPLLIRLVKERGEEDITGSKPVLKLNVQIGESRMTVIPGDRSTTEGDTLEGILGGEILMYSARVHTVMFLYRDDAFLDLSDQDIAGEVDGRLGLPPGTIRVIADGVARGDCGSFDVLVTRSQNLVNIFVRDQEMAKLIMDEAEAAAIGMYEEAKREAFRNVKLKP